MSAYKIEIFRKGGKWTARIRHRNGRIIFSSGSQRYSRRIDCERATYRFISAAREGLKVKS